MYTLKYVNQNKLIITLLLCISIDLCYAKVPFDIVGLFKNRVVIIDEFAENKIIAVGEYTDNGFQLIAANSRTAIFKDPNGNLLESGVSGQISTQFMQSTEIVELIQLNEKHEYLTKININDSPSALPAIIDTGANFVALNGNTARALGINYSQGKRVNIATAGGNVIGFKVMLSKVQLGRIIQTEVEALVLEGNSPGVILIGMSFLKMLELKYADNKLELKFGNTSNP